MSNSDISALTELLRLPEKSPILNIWLAEQERKIAGLPAQLRRPKAFIPRILEKFISKKAILCPSHKKLDPQLIRRLFITFADECTIRVRHFTDAPPEDTDIKQWLARVQSINSLWTEPDMYRYLFNTKSSEPKLDYIQSECEACILATIGGNRIMLADLRICAETRRRAHSPTPRIIRILEGWLHWTGISHQIKTITEPLFLKVRTDRRKRQRERRHGSPTPRLASKHVKENRERNQEEPETTGAEIIDFYLNRLSSMPSVEGLSVRPNNDSRTSLHPAFRNSISFDASTGTYAQCQEEDIPLVPKVPSNIPEPNTRPRVVSSIYSQDDSGLESSIKTAKKKEWTNKDFAEQRAEAYRKLVDIPEASELEREDTNSLDNPDLSSPKRVTRWPDICNAPGPNKLSEDRAAAYRTLVGKPEYEELSDGDKKMLIENRFDSSSNLLITWEDFCAAHDPIGHLPDGQYK